ncbi:CvpA family protein [candidate division WOR-3 bacterium]|nr:CvpA family protein [candidate division WOR-3 bacterium]
MWLDIIAIIIIIGCVIHSFIKGAIREVFSLGGLIVGIYVGSKFYKLFAEILPISNVKIANVVSFIVLFIITALIINFIGFILRKTLHILRIGFIDKLIGGVLGFIGGTLIVGLICLFLSLFPAGKSAVRHSKIAPIVFKELSWIKGLFPKDIQKKLKWKTKRQTVIKIQDTLV